MAKYQEIAELLRHQVERGEYPTGKLPPLRKLAMTMGVSYLTARQAVKAYNDAGGYDSNAGRPLVAMVTPLWAFTEWHRAIRDEVPAMGGRVRFIAYGSDTDPIISDVLSQEEYDLIFLYIPQREDPRLRELIAKVSDRVIVMFRDMTQLGVRCLDGANPVGIERFLEILKARGVKRVDALGRDTDLDSNLQVYYRVWREWIDRNGMEGRFFSVKHQSFEPDDLKALDTCRGILERKELGKAVFCFFPTLATGLYRACYEHGLIPGRDISIFGFGDYDRAKLMTPALATVRDVKIAETIRTLLMEYRPGAKRSARMMFRPDQTDIFMGESLIE